MSKLSCRKSAAVSDAHRIKFQSDTELVQRSFNYRDVLTSLAPRGSVSELSAHGGTTQLAALGLIHVTISRRALTRSAPVSSAADVPTSLTQPSAGATSRPTGQI